MDYSWYCHLWFILLVFGGSYVIRVRYGTSVSSPYRDNPRSHICCVTSNIVEVSDKELQSKSTSLEENFSMVRLIYVNLIYLQLLTVKCRVSVIVFNATFNNMSVTSFWKSLTNFIT
jgi:hypothetical protein